jgi:hypothetical protein
VLLWQIEDDVIGGVTDRALELTLKTSEGLTEDERDELLGGFFDVDWHNHIFPRPRYKELFLQRVHDVMTRAMAGGLTWLLPADLDDAALETRLYPSLPAAQERARPDFVASYRELTCRGVRRAAETP